MNDYPVQVRIDYPTQSSRGWAILTIFLIKFLALIPHAIVLAVLGIAAAIAFVIAQVAVVARGVFPPGLFDFLTGYVRWYTRVNAFLFSLTDRYPPFSLRSAPDCPVDVEVEYPNRSSKALAALSLLFVVLAIVGSVFLIRYLAHHATPSSRSWRYQFSSFSNFGDNPLAVFRLILLIPHLIIVGIIGIAAFIVWIIVQWVILFIARFPEGMHKFVAQWMGWGVRVAVYSNGLTDRYPPFSLETVEWGPAAAGAAAGASAPPPPPLPPPPGSPPPGSPPTSGGARVDDRFPPRAGEERTTELPAPPQEQAPPAAPPSSQEALPEPPGDAAGEAPPEEPPEGLTEPPSPPSAPPPPTAPH